MIHVLKVHPDEYRRLVLGLKTAEFRKDDREPRFAIGDELVEFEWDPAKQERTGRGVLLEVTDLCRGAFGIPDDHCTLSVRMQLHWTADGPASKWTTLRFEAVRKESNEFEELRRQQLAASAERRRRIALDRAARRGAPPGTVVPLDTPEGRRLVDDANRAASAVDTADDPLRKAGTNHNFAVLDRMLEEFNELRNDCNTVFNVIARFPSLDRVDAAAELLGDLRRVLRNRNPAAPKHF